MKITFVLPYAGLAGGIRVVAIYASLLKRRGHEVVVVSTPAKPMSLKQRIKKFLREGRWPIQLPEPSHFDGLDVDHRIIKKYRAITDDDVPDADVVIATWWETAEWIESLSTSKGRKVYFIQGYDVRPDQPMERVSVTYRYPFRKIAVSNWLVGIMKSEYGDNDVALIPNSVDHVFFDSPAKKRQEKPTIGFVYTTASFKGCDIIIDAINAVMREIPTLRVVVFGAYHPTAELPLPPSAEFHYRPNQETIRDIYSACDFWLFGSRNEGFGLPILEAMACRTPVIATKAGAAPELVSQGGGVLVEELSSVALASAIIRCLDFSEEQWRRYSTIARETVTQYDWEQAADLFERSILI